MNEIGYCCINLSINEDGRKKVDYIKVNRGMIKKTFQEKGLIYVSELVIENLKDTIKILNWNIKNNIKVYRLSSDSFPWLTEYKIEELPNFDKIKNLLNGIGKIIIKNNLRISYHPGPFNVLGSLNNDVVNKTIHELNFTSSILDYMNLEQSTYYPINIHINNTKPTHIEASERFCNNFYLLSESAKKRLTVENDDGLNQYSAKMLYDLIYQKIKIPIVFDFHHYLYGPQDQLMEDALKLSLSTWTTKPMTHMSSSKLLEQQNVKQTAHADFIYEKIPYFDKYEFDCEIEAKSKDKAVLKYIKDYN
jgi:UV DNA damage endonuclease